MPSPSRQPVQRRMDVGMAQGHCQGISGICHRPILQPEDQLHHVLYLFLCRPSTADDRLFDLGWGILEYIDPPAYPGTDGSASGLPQFQRGCWVFRHENLLYGHRFRSKLIDYLTDTGKDLTQS